MPTTVAPRRDYNSTPGRPAPSRRAANARRAERASASPDEWLTVEELCEELKIGRRTFERLRARGKGPRVKRLGGTGAIRIRRSWMEEWMEADG